MDIKAAELVSQTGGRAMGPLNEHHPVNRICTDTRLVEKNDAFFAFPGERFDGHDFLEQAVEKGARHLLVSEPGRVTDALSKKANFIAVQDTVRAYGDLARFYRKKFNVPAIAITGSSGKTTVKELAAHLLSAKLKTLKNRGTENNLIGVPKTLFQMDPSHQVLALEMGTNQPGEIERLSSIVSPQIGVLTQIGASHLEGLKNIGGVLAEKMQIRQKLERGGRLILNGEDPMLKDVQSGVHKVLRVGFSAEGTALWAGQVKMNSEGTSFVVNKEHRFETRLLGAHNVLNCLLALECALCMGLDIPTLQKALKEFKPVPGRLCFKNLDGVNFLDDSYNSNPTSFGAALETVSRLRSGGKKGLVCGDMLELGDQSEDWHRKTGKKIASLAFDFVVATGEQCKFLVEEAVKGGYHRSQLFHVQDSLAAGKLCRRLAGTGDLVLVKGSRGMQMEKVFECYTDSSIR